MLRVTFIHPKALGNLYALRKGGLNPTLKLYIYMRFSRGPKYRTSTTLLYIALGHLPVAQPINNLADWRKTSLGVRGKMHKNDDRA